MLLHLHRRGLTSHNPVTGTQQKVCSTHGNEAKPRLAGHTESPCLVTGQGTSPFYTLALPSPRCARQTQAGPAEWPRCSNQASLRQEGDLETPVCRPPSTFCPAGLPFGRSFEFSPSRLSMGIDTAARLKINLAPQGTPTRVPLLSVSPMGEFMLRLLVLP